MLIDNVYDKTAEIIRYEPGSWGSEDEYIAFENAPCRIRLLSGREQNAGGKLTVVATHRVYMPVVTLTEQDRLTIDGQEYEIVLVNQPTESEHLEVDVLRIQ